MSEEVEIDKLEKLIDRCNECKFATCENCEINWTEVQAIKGLLDLYKNLKEIEKSHKKENGKLRVELEQEKEKNNKLEIELSTRDNINVDKLLENYRYYRQLANSYQANCISKDKIMEIRDKAEVMDYYTLNDVIDDLSKLVEGK